MTNSINYRYQVVQGEMILETGISTDDLEEAKKIVERLNSELTSDKFDNCEEYWILDTKVNGSI